MKKTKIKKQFIDTKIVTVFCDKCGTEIKEQKGDAFDCTIELQVGEYDGYEGFIGENHRVDLCKNCAKFVFTKLMPNNGINVINENNE